jgi:hypothetical protein
MRKAGGDPKSAVGIEMRKAGGEQQEFKTNAMPGSKPGECVYSFKQLPLGTYDVGVQEIHFKPLDDNLPLPKDKFSAEFWSAAQRYKEQKGETAYLLKYSDKFDKWLPAAGGGIWVKSAYKELKLDGKSSAGPVITYTGPTFTP